MCKITTFYILSNKLNAKKKGKCLLQYYNIILQTIGNMIFRTNNSICYVHLTSYNPNRGDILNLVKLTFVIWCSTWCGHLFFCFSVLCYYCSCKSISIKWSLKNGTIAYLLKKLENLMLVRKAAAVLTVTVRHHHCWNIDTKRNENVPIDRLRCPYTIKLFHPEQI